MEYIDTKSVHKRENVQPRNCDAKVTTEVYHTQHDHTIIWGGLENNMNEYSKTSYTFNLQL